MLVGRFFRSPQGRPIVGAAIGLRSPGAARARWVTTDPRGRFTFDVGAGRYNLETSIRGRTQSAFVVAPAPEMTVAYDVGVTPRGALAVRHAV